ncbi:hypothetical protein ACVWY5_001439 [Bradyrhizobium sp. USDA 3256]
MKYGHGLVQDVIAVLILSALIGVSSIRMKLFADVLGEIDRRQGVQVALFQALDGGVWL